MSDETTNGTSPELEGLWDRFAQPLHILRRDLALAIVDHSHAERTLATIKTLAESEAERHPLYATCKNEGERSRFISVHLTGHVEYQEAAEDEAVARMECDIYRTEIQIREDARRDRQMAQRDRELDILAGNLALDERKQAHIEKQGAEMSERLAELHAKLDAVHGAHESEGAPITHPYGRA